MAYARAMVMRDALVTIEGVEYRDQVSKVRLVPDTAIQTMQTFGGVDQDRGRTTWTLELSGHQDRGATGLAAALDAAADIGDPIEIEIQAELDTGADVATCMIVPIPVEFGGESGAFKLFEQTFAVIDSPVFTESGS